MRFQSFLWAPLAAAALASAACESFVAQPPAQAQIDRETEDVMSTSEIYALVPTLDASRALERRARRRGYRLSNREMLDELDLVLLAFQTPRGRSGPAAIRELEALEPRATVGVNHRYTLQESNTPAPAASGFAPRRYASSMVGWPAAGCAAAVAVGMIDGAVDPADPGLASAVVVSRDFTGGAPGAARHGAALAELLVGDGRLRGARLFAAAVVRDDSAGPGAAGAADLVRALNWMAQNNAPVVNVSLAGPYNKLLDRAVQQAVDRGMIIVAAVGNHGAASPPRYPAAFNGVIAATAIDKAQQVFSQAVNGDHVDFAAPGVDVFVGASGGRYVSGTSIAAPFVTARIASDPAAVSSGGARAARRVVRETVVDLGAAGRDPIFGEGLVQSPGCPIAD